MRAVFRLRLPQGGVYGRKESVGVGHAPVHKRELEIGGHVHAFRIYLPAAYHHHLPGVRTHGYGSLEARRRLGARRSIPGVARDNDIAPSGQSARQRLECAAPHHQRLAHGETPEAAHILGDAEQKPAPAAYRAVGGQGGYDGYFLVHTLTVPFMWG